MRPKTINFFFCIFGQYVYIIIAEYYFCRKLTECDIMQRIYRVVGIITGMDFEMTEKLVNCKIGKDDIWCDGVFKGNLYALHIIYDENVRVCHGQEGLFDDRVNNCELKDINSITPVIFDDGELYYIADIKDGDFIDESGHDIAAHDLKAFL